MKTYIKPQVETRQIEMESMICSSDSFNNTLNSDPINNSGEILSKGHDFDLWDIDDEE